MKINVPVISTNDVLIIGGTLKAVSLGLELKKSGLSVFIATPYSYFGEDICAKLNLQSKKSDEYKTLLGTDQMLLPIDIKGRLDRAIIDAGIDFLFQLRPIRPMYSSDGKISGTLFASRSGFHAIAAKVVIDATERQTFARSAEIQTKTFKPGTYKMSLVSIGGAPTDNPSLGVTKLPNTIKSENREYSAYRTEMDWEFKGNSMFDFAEANTEIRKKTWVPDAVAYAHEFAVDLDDGIIDSYVPSASTPVFLADRATVKEIADLAGGMEMPVPASFGEKPSTKSPSFDVVRKDQYFRFADYPTIPFDLNSFDTITDCDVFVAGGGTGGAPAAIGAARRNMRTICAENLASLGGIMLTGRIGVYYYGNRVGFTREVDLGINSMGENPDFDIEKGTMNVVWKNEWFLERATEKGAIMLFETMTAAAVMDGNTARGALVVNPFGAGIIASEFVIDSTGNCDFAAAAGAEIMSDLVEEPAVQGAGLSPVVLGRNCTNTDFTFIMDSDIVDATRAYVTARGKYTDSFDISTILNTRERRRVRGDIVLQPYDFFANRVYSDTINIAMSNFDTHGFIIHPMFMIKPTARDSRFANVPLRALLPRGFENILVTGLGVSAHRDCLPLIRMQPDVQNQGYAAGLAAAMAVKGKTPIRSINVRELQRKLVAEDILPQRTLEEKDEPCTYIEDDDFRYISNVFIDPDAAKIELKSKLERDPDDVESATILAFLGDDSGSQLLKDTIMNSTWDEGWNYTGMGQFGFSVSKLDAMIIALSCIGGDKESTLTKLKTLSFETEFSHIRAVMLALIRKPVPEAAPLLEKLLSEPDARGHAIVTMHDALASNRPDYNDTTVRNSQLRELYIGKALAACDPESETGNEIVESYAKGMQGIYSIFALGV
ncbi:MAG: FAD-dependent oxidoreductase [Lentisphaerae bacterium]|jgi:hypothetical protein|nr:FAD-dependent oxidoreductase [Lentisphaerota bacterium]